MTEYSDIKQETMILTRETIGHAQTLSSLSKIGACIHTPNRGWKFHPYNAAHKPSRRYWSDANACIPKWAFDMSNGFYTASELE